MAKLSSLYNQVTGRVLDLPECEVWAGMHRCECNEQNSDAVESRMRPAIVGHVRGTFHRQASHGGPRDHLDCMKSEPEPIRWPNAGEIPFHTHINLGEGQWHELSAHSLGCVQSAAPPVYR